MSTIQDLPRVVNVIGTPCLLTSSKQLTATIEHSCLSNCHRKDPAPISIDFTNAHIVALRSKDEGFRKATNSVDKFVSDSQVLTWAISISGGRNHERVYGPEFLNFFVEHAQPSLRHYFLGGSDDCLEKLILNLKKNQPTLEVVGKTNGYFSEADSVKVCKSINEAAPDCLWVGLGTPKQQYWIAKNKDRLAAKVILAVGFAFDVNAGTKSDAPKWMGPMGLTWLYRLASEPKRLFGRYAYYNTIFLFGLAKQLLGRAN